MDTDAEMPVNRLNFSGILSTNSSNPSSSNKRKRFNESLPKSKKRRTSSNNSTPRSTRAISLDSIDETSPMSVETDTKTANENDTKTANISHHALRRSPRIRNKQQIKAETDLNIELFSSLSLSPVTNRETKITSNRDRNHNSNHDILSKSLSKSFSLKWNSAATPIQSSLKKHRKKRMKTKTAQRIQYKRRVNWGNIECRNYEQRCGILSSAVPSENGPSLHLGRLLSETTTNIDAYESGKECGDKWGELSKKERIQRVKQFSEEDVAKVRLKQDMDEIKSLKKSRNDIGCKCISIYKMKKSQIIWRIIYLRQMDDADIDKKNEMKTLKKQRKPDLFNILIKIQFDKYGRYDVCCVDEACICVKEGIECQIDYECCSCGGDIVYNNNTSDIEMEDKRQKNKNKIVKKNSLCCGNPNGNTLNVSVLDYMDNSCNLHQHDVAKRVESTFLPFKSPVVQMRISEWNEHYGADDDEGNNKENGMEDKVQCVLNFDTSNHL